MVALKHEQVEESDPQKVHKSNTTYAQVEHWRYSFCVRLLGGAIDKAWPDFLDCIIKESGERFSGFLRDRVCVRMYVCVCARGRVCVCVCVCVCGSLLVS